MLDGTGFSSYYKGRLAQKLLVKVAHGAALDTDNR